MESGNKEMGGGVIKTMGFQRIRDIITVGKKLYGNYKFRLLILVGLGFLGGLAEAVGIGILVPLFSYVVNEGAIGQDFISQTLVTAFSYFGLELRLASLMILICSLFLLKAFVLLIFGYINIHIMADYENNIKRDLYRDALGASWPHLMGQKIGYLERVLVVHVSFVTRLFQQISNNILGVTSFIMYTFVAFKLSLSVTLATLALGGIFLLVLRPVMKQTKLFSKKRAKVEDMINHFINENILGIKTVKAMAAEKEVRRVATDAFDQLKAMRIKLQVIKSFGSVFIQPLGLIFISIVFAFFYLRPNFNFAVFVATMYLIQRLFAYVDKAQGSSYVISESIPYINTLIAFKEELHKHQEVDGGEEKFVLSESLEMRDISFSYAPGKRVLTDINFKIKKGEMIGIIGPSGAGKTTIVDLLLRLFTPEKGGIFLDGKNAESIRFDEWRRNIGYVSQDIFLKNDTIANNIMFYDNSISEKDMVDAARIAQIYDFVESLPHKFGTVVGERGVLLSMGQRQRVVLARVLARKPKILILDEATSALDNESELLIKQAIEKLKGELTVIVIAHRLSTITSADRLLSVENGMVVEEGSPEKLLANKSSYFYKVYNISE